MPSTNPVADDALIAIARELATYGLGIFVPHEHVSTGEIVPLASGRMSLERDGRVSFAQTADFHEGVTPVGWRWNGVALEVCAGCCSDDGGPPGIADSE